MKVGIWLPNNFVPEHGGSYSYINKLVNNIDLYKFDESINICFITTRATSFDLKRDIYTVDPLSKCGFLYNILSKLRISEFFYRAYYRFFKKRISKKLVSYKINLVYYLKQGECVLQNFPFISTNWDIGHCSTFSFPEINDKNEFQRRTKYYRDILPRALNVISESDSGKRELLRYTNIGAHKIDVMPLFAGGVCDIKISSDEIDKRIKKLGLESKSFFFYPAQFWAHKNHIAILDALREIRCTYPDVIVAFCGSDKGNLDYIESKIDEFELSKNIRHFGFLPISDVRALYERCVSLVFPTFFGPTNMPIIEALQLGIPVVCSDIDGHREILGDSGLYFNMYNSKSLIDSMNLMLSESYIYKNKIEIQSKNNKFRVENSLYCLNEILLKLKYVRETWA